MEPIDKEKIKKNKLETDDIYKIEIKIELNEEYDLNTLYIDLKSDKLEVFKENDIKEIIDNNGIIIENNKCWIGSEKSFVAFYGENRNDMIKLKNNLLLYKKFYKKIVIHSYKKNNGFCLFAIHKELLKSYFIEINKNMEDLTDIKDVNIYICISNSFEKNKITNETPEHIEKYLFINLIILENIPDFEIILPFDLSQIIFKLQNDEEINENEKILYKKLKENIQTYIQKKNIDISIKLQITLEEELSFSVEELNKIFLKY
jgi:hypothetical protein